MALFLTLSRGPRADLAVPVVASSDRRVVTAVLTAIGRLGEIDAEDDGVTNESRCRPCLKVMERTDEHPA